MMTEDRFAALAEAYGGDIARWPAEVRADAEAFTAMHAEAAAVLERERGLDAALDADVAGAPGALLRQRVIDSAPAALSAGRIWRWLTGAGLGLGLAAACACGVAAGMTLAPPSVTRMISGPPAESSDELTALIDPATDPEGA
jgi:hypothetical protein